MRCGRQVRCRVVTIFVIGVVIGGRAGIASGATLTVATHGTDDPGCGGKATPCRTIGRAITNAGAGDTIVVGPGRYGDVDFDGKLTSPGDEAPAANCTIRVEKRLSILSRDGAATTVLSSGGASAGPRVVCLLASGVTFGKPKKGFTVSDGLYGIRVGSDDDGNDTSLSDVVVSGNRSTNNAFGFVIGGRNTVITGNQAVDNERDGFRVGGTSVILTANSASGNDTGFAAFFSAAGVQLRGNVSTRNGTGFLINPPNAVVTGCVASGNSGIGFTMRLGTGTITKSAAIGNGGAGIDVGFDGPDVVSDCTVVGNGTGASSPNCGVENIGTVPVTTTNLFWGSASGPGADPADDTCKTGGAIGVPSFATKEGKVKPKLPAID